MKLKGKTKIGLILITGMAVVISPIIKPYIKIRDPIIPNVPESVIRTIVEMDGRTTGVKSQIIIGKDTNPIIL